MYTNILVPLDGSRFAETVLPHAIALASKFDCKVTLVKVFEIPQVYQSAANKDVLMDIHQAAVKDSSDYLDEVKDKLIAEGLKVEVNFIEGDNVPILLLEAIEESKADLVVMSTHGRSGLDRWRFGSVAQRIVRHSSVPIVLIHPRNG